MKPIPAIDLLEGKVVRLRQGDYQAPTIYYNNPIDAARVFADAGIEELHIVDLNGAKDGKFNNLKHIEQIASETGLTIQNGGGVRSYEDARVLLDSGVSRVVCSSMAAKKPTDFEKLISLNNGDHAVLGLDIKDGSFAYGGWLDTSEGSYHEIIEQFLSSGLKYVLSTDISRDGMMEGPNMVLYKELIQHYPDLYIIASGGVANVSDLEDLSRLPIYGVIVGKAYYENYISLDDLINFDKTNR